MRESGVSVYAMDLRGQGWSDRLLDDPQKGHIDSFDNYVEDLKTYRDTIVMATPHAKTILFGHSTGGAASTLYLENYPGDFDAAILHSPMHQIKTSPYPQWFATALTGVFDFIGKEDDYALGKGPYKEDATFADNGTEHSLERWTASRDLSTEFPETKIGGPTNQWVHKSIAATKALQNNAWRIKTPFLLLQAHQDDVVVPAGQDNVCNAANRNGAVCEKVAFGDPSLSVDACHKALSSGDTATADRCAGHEILFERDRTRSAVEAAMSSYIDKVTGVVR
jgi:lysophospholipase